MEVAQGQPSFRPVLNDAGIEKQIEYGLNKGWAVAIEYTDDPHPRNRYWSIWGNPTVELRDPATVMRELVACREHHADKFIKVLAFDAGRGRESVRMSLLVQRPELETGSGAESQDAQGRGVGPTSRSHSHAGTSVPEQAT